MLDEAVQWNCNHGAVAEKPAGEKLRALQPAPRANATR